MTDPRIVECSCCGGEGRVLESAWVYEHGSGHGHWDALDAGPCPHCDGTGGEIIETQPIELEDLEQEFVSWES